MEASSPSGEGGDLREELRGDAQTLRDTAKDRIYTRVDAGKGTAATQAKSLSSALDAAAGELKDSPDWLRSLVQQGAQSLQRFSDTLQNKEPRELTRDVQQLARDNPGVFLAGCAAAGFAAARVLKAGVPESSPGSSDGGPSNSSTRYDPYQQQQPNAPTSSVFAGMDEREANARPASRGEM